MSATVTLTGAIEQWRDPSATLGDTEQFCNCVSRMKRWLRVRRSTIDGHNPFQLAKARLAAGEPIDESLDTELRDFVAASGPGWQETPVFHPLGVEALLKRYGSREVVRYIREVCCQDQDQRQRFWKAVIGHTPQAFETWQKYSSLPEATEPILLRCRISYAHPGLEASRLSNPADAGLEGMKVDFERGDSILFDLKKMLADPRCHRRTQTEVPESIAGRHTSRPRNRDAREASGHAYHESQDWWIYDVVKHVYKDHGGMKGPEVFLETGKVMAQVLRRSGSEKHVLAGKTVERIYYRCRKVLETGQRPPDCKPLARITLLDACNKIRHQSCSIL